MIFECNECEDGDNLVKGCECFNCGLIKTEEGELL